MVLGMDVLGTTQALMIDYQRHEVRLLGRGLRNTVRIRESAPPASPPQ